MPEFWLNAAVTADLVIVHGSTVLVIRRASAPFDGRLALPGGFVEPDEEFVDGAARELEEETGVTGVDSLEQFGVYGKPGRDPRGRVITIAFAAVIPEQATPRAGSDASDARWVPVDEVLADPAAMAFDHHTILTDGLAHLAARAT